MNNEELRELLQDAYNALDDLVNKRATEDIDAQACVVMNDLEAAMNAMDALL
jgi:hypothetical protein